MDHLNKLKALRDEARARIEAAKRAIDEGADGRMVASLDELIAELEKLSAAPRASGSSPRPQSEKVPARPVVPSWAGRRNGGKPPVGNAMPISPWVEISSGDESSRHAAKLAQQPLIPPQPSSEADHPALEGETAAAQTDQPAAAAHASSVLETGDSELGEAPAPLAEEPSMQAAAAQTDQPAAAAHPFSDPETGDSVVGASCASAIENLVVGPPEQMPDEPAIAESHDVKELNDVKLEPILLEELVPLLPVPEALPLADAR